MRNRLIIIFLLIVCSITTKAEHLKMWYRQPAKVWTEALPLGNSHLGAMVYGGVVNEEIQLNEETLWGEVLTRMIIRKPWMFSHRYVN